MKISIIAALDSKNGIGKGNDLLFRIAEDFARMQKLTMGHPIIMGRKTFESIGRILPGRTNIIITTNIKYKISPASTSEAGRANIKDQNLIVVHSLEEGIEKAKEVPGSDEIFIFGGGQIFKEALDKNLVDKLYLTIVEGDYSADTFFPDYSSFRVVSEQEHESGDYKFKFLTLTK